MTSPKYIIYSLSISENGKKISFEDHYEPIVDRWYIAGEEQASKVFIGPEVAYRKCSICSKNEPQVSFKTESHIIPASLGNRIFFSNEECDECNERFANSCEEQLALMTEPERALYQLPTRGKPPSWTLPGESKQFSFDPNYGIQMTINDPNGSLRMTHLEDQKTIKIAGPAKPYSPVGAIKSLIKTCWLFMPEAHRNNHEYLRSILLNDLTVAPFRYIVAHLPDWNSRLVSFKVYTRKSRSELPALILELTVAHQKIIWAAPDIDKNTFSQFPIPPIRARPEAPPPSITEFKIPSLDHVIDRRSASFDFTYSSLVQLDENQKVNSIKKRVSLAPKRNSQLVTLMIATETRTAKIENMYYRKANQLSSNPTISLSNTYPFRLKITNGLGDTASLKYECKPSGRPLTDVATALDCVDLIANHDPEITILNSHGQVLLSFPCKNGVPTSFDFEFNLLNMLSEISDFWSLELKYPTMPPTDSELDDIYYLHSILTEKNLPQGSGKLSATVTDLEALNKIENQTFVTTIIARTLEFSILGIKLTAPRHEIDFLNCQIERLEKEADGWKVEIKYDGQKYKLIHI
jgi:hypothetical protein